MFKVITLMFRVITLMFRVITLMFRVITLMFICDYGAVYGPHIPWRPKAITASWALMYKLGQGPLKGFIGRHKTGPSPRGAIGEAQDRPRDPP